MSKTIIYTEGAKVQLRKFHTDIGQQVESYLMERLAVPGDDVVEVKASDVEEATNRIRLLGSSNRRLGTLKLASATYIFLGIITVIVGLFFDDLKRLYTDENRTQFVLVFVGIVMSTVGFFLSAYLKYRNSAEIDNLRRRELLIEEKLFRSEVRSNEEQDSLLPRD